MFAEFERPRGNVLQAPVNSILGSIFLGTLGLWAAMFIWNVSTGTDPLTRAVTAAVTSHSILEEK